MYSHIQNRKGEKLYILTSVFTNSIKPHIIVNTWKKCKEWFEDMTTEIHDPSFCIQLIHKTIDEETHTAEASLRCNEKCQDCNYFEYITIEPLYTEDW